MAHDRIRYAPAEMEAYLKPSERQPESKSTPWFAAAASATARTALFAVEAAIGAAFDQALSGNHDPGSDRLVLRIIHLRAGAARAFRNGGQMEKRKWR